MRYVSQLTSLTKTTTRQRATKVDKRPVIFHAFVPILLKLLLSKADKTSNWRLRLQNEGYRAAFVTTVNVLMAITNRSLIIVTDRAWYFSNACSPAHSTHAFFGDGVTALFSGLGALRGEGELVAFFLFVLIDNILILSTDFKF